MASHPYARPLTSPSRAVSSESTHESAQQAQQQQIRLFSPTNMKVPHGITVPYLAQQLPLTTLSHHSELRIQPGAAALPQPSEAAATRSTNPIKPLSCTCRFCNCTLSSSSNRRRHERLKHATELQSHLNTLAAGASRKQSSENAFVKPNDATAMVSLVGAECKEQEEMSLSMAEPCGLPSSAAAANSEPTKERDAIDHAFSDLHFAESEQAASADTELLKSSKRETIEADDVLGAVDDETKEEDGQVVMEDIAEELTGDSPPHQLMKQPAHPTESVQLMDPTQPAASVHPEESVQPVELVQSVEPVQPPEPLQATVATEPAADEVLQAVGARPLLQEEDLQTACYPFLQWLTSPCMTACEALVKSKRVKSLSQLIPIKCSLRFIFALLYESRAIDVIDLKVLLRLSVCQALYQSIVDRQVGSGRTHQIFLLVKKLLVFLSSSESAKTRQFVQPTAYESYLYVDNICSESSNQRKQEARNRMVLGITGARGALTKPREVFQIPKTWSGGATAAAQVPAAPAAIPTEQVAFAAAAAAQHSTEGDSINQVMTKEELGTVTQASLAYLNSMVGLYADSQSSGSVVPESNTDILFVHHLITATLCLGLAPRSQVLQQLRIGSSLTKEADGRYWIRMLAEQSKNGRPTMFALAVQLTPAYDVYLEFVRPHLWRRTALAGTGMAQHDYVFFKRNGAAPRTDFSSSTSLVTQQILGRPVNAHAFRSSLITTFYSSGASEAEMSMLASIMAHDPATQRDFYYKPKHSEAAVQASQRMVNQLLISTATNTR